MIADSRYCHYSGPAVSLSRTTIAFDSDRSRRPGTTVCARRAGVAAVGIVRKETAPCCVSKDRLERPRHERHQQKTQPQKDDVAIGYDGRDEEAAPANHH